MRPRWSTGPVRRRFSNVSSELSSMNVCIENELLDLVFRAHTKLCDERQWSTIPGQNRGTTMELGGFPFGTLIGGEDDLDEVLSRCRGVWVTCDVCWRC